MGNEIALLDRKKNAFRTIKAMATNGATTDAIILQVLELYGLGESFTLSILKRLGHGK